MVEPRGDRLTPPSGRAARILALLGATFGTLLDYTHVRTGAIAYPSVSFLGVPLWVPFLYTGAALSIGLSHPLADRWLRRPPRPPLSRLEVAAGFGGFLAVWVLSGALPFSTGVVAGVLAPLSLALWLWLDRTWQGLVLAASTAAIGVLVEVTLSRAGLFRHTHPDVMGVAVWLPWIYVSASVGIGNLGRALQGGSGPR